MRCRFLFTLFLKAAVASSLTSDSIRSLNETLGGRVRHVEPFALPCFSTFEGSSIQRDNNLCSERQENYNSASYRRGFPGAYMFEQSSICASHVNSTDQCLLDPADPANPEAWIGVDCRLGNLPKYYIEVKDAQHVVETFRYARENPGTKISIKNSGHSYVEDSSAKDSLVLWTFRLKHLRRDRDFVPEGCPSDRRPVDSITTGAGVSCAEAYKFAHGENVTILCGISPTVGISGGWVQGAGHSVLSNVYGLGVDRVLQFTVVTPDGILRVANACQNSDLFWALRGGGGGTFGLVLDSTHKVEPQIPLAVADIGVPSENTSVVGGWLDLLVDTAINLADDGWGGHIIGNEILYVNPLISDLEGSKESLRDVISFAETNNGHVNITRVPGWYGFFEEHELNKVNLNIGKLNLLNTRLVPTSVFINTTLREGLKLFLRDIVDSGKLPYVPVDSPYLFKEMANATSVHPVWYDSIWELGQPSFWSWNDTLKDRLELVANMQKQTEMQKAVVPGGAAYMNEANPFAVDWQEDWWGDNYKELLRIKKKYDPVNILRCWRCVGWTDEDARESCYSAF